MQVFSISQRIKGHVNYSKINIFWVVLDLGFMLHRFFRQVWSKYVKLHQLNHMQWKLKKKLKCERKWFLMAKTAVIVQWFHLHKFYQFDGFVVYICIYICIYEEIYLKCSNHCNFVPIIRKFSFIRVVWINHLWLPTACLSKL